MKVTEKGAIHDDLRKNISNERSEEGTDILHDIEDEQLREYEDMLNQLGVFPDKVLINTLSMIAEDYSAAHLQKSSFSLYQCIRSLLVSKNVSPDRKLPLVYVVDSILKNVRSTSYYIDIMRMDIPEWMSIVHSVLNEVSRMKLRRVWITWKEFQLFPENDWKKMGKCFVDADEQLRAEKMMADAKVRAAGISRNIDGTLKLSTSLRKKMQLILDNVQNESVEELDKVSLERLADIDPNLLVEIKKVAQEVLSEQIDSGVNSVTGGVNFCKEDDDDILGLTKGSNLFVDPRAPEVVKRFKSWKKLDMDLLDKSHEIIVTLQRHVMTATSGVKIVDDVESQVAIAKILGAASATALHLTNMLERLKKQNSNLNDNTMNPSYLSKDLLDDGSFIGISGATSITRRFDRGVNRSKFTTEGIMVENEEFISLLYDAGLPFVSSSDGRRFATQIDLSRHLDDLFRRNQLEKTMERSEERGWYHIINDHNDSANHLPSVAYNVSATSTHNDVSRIINVDSTGVYKLPLSCEKNENPSYMTVTADESRDRCVICGINFTLHFDQDEGEWKYSNCTEINVINNDKALESKAMLVHMTCLRGLGSPHFLMMDQILQR